jgi:hypothetical protein
VRLSRESVEGLGRVEETACSPRLAPDRPACLVVTSYRAPTLSTALFITMLPANIGSAGVERVVRSVRTRLMASEIGRPNALRSNRINRITRTFDRSGD